MGIRLLVAAKQRVFSVPTSTLSSSPARQHHSPPASAIHGLVKDSSDIENIKGYCDLQMTTSRYFSSGNRSVNYLEDVSIYSSILMSSSSHFSLLNENVVKIENILADTDSVRLEEEILIHIRRLGALELFHACLTKSLMPLAEASPNPQHTDYFRHFSKEYSIKQDTTVVPSVKKEGRKLRRSRAKEKNDLTSHSSNCKRISLPLTAFLSKSRSVISRNESELSMAVKDVASLERIRLKLETKSGEEVCHKRWAEAAGIDLQTLYQRLHVGWHGRDELIRSTRTLVFFFARKYEGIGVAIDDLLQAGTIGVLKGAEKFDNSRGFCFSTYARYWIRKSMLSLITRNSRGIQLPAMMVKAIRSMQDASNNFRMREGRFPEDVEIADLTNLSLATVRLARRCSRAMGSLDQSKIANLMESTPDASIETPFEFLLKQRKKGDISGLLESLHPRERQVLVLRYGLDDGRSKSLGEIGSLCNVSKEWIRRIERAAMADIRCRFVQEEFNFY